MQTVTDRLPKALEAGAYELEWNGGPYGAELVPKKFTLSKGGQQVVEVRRGPEFAGEVRRTASDMGRAQVALLADGRQCLAAQTDGTLVVWDLETGRPVRFLKGHTGVVWGLAALRDGKRAVSAGNDGTLRLWDTTTGEARIIASDLGNTWGLVLASNGVHALCAFSNRLLLVDMAAGKIVRQWAAGTKGILSVALSPDGRWGLTSDAGGQVILWDVTTGKKEHSFQSQATVATVVFSPDGRLALSTSGDGTARLWDLAARKELHVIRVPPTLVTGALFSPDGRRFLLTCQDQTGRLYEVATREEIYRFTTAGFFNFQAIMADGRRLVLSNSGGLSVRQLPGPDHPEGQLLLQGDNVYAPVLVKGEGQPARTVNNTPGGTVLDLRQGDYTLEPTAQRSWPASRLSAQRVSVKAGRQVVVRVLRDHAAGDADSRAAGGG